MKSITPVNKTNKSQCPFANNHVSDSENTNVYENLLSLDSFNPKEDFISKAEIESLEREKHLLAVANSVQDAIVSADNRGNIIFWNEGARRSFGYDADEVIGKSLTMIMPERFRKAHSEGMKRYLQSGEKKVIGQVVELFGLHKDGSEFPIELSLGVWDTEKGKYFTGIMRDIRSRLQAENALRESENRMRTLLENMSEGLLKVNQDDVVEFVNDSFCKMLGFQPGEILNQKVGKFLFSDDDEPYFFDVSGGIVKNSSPDHFELMLRTKLGKVIYVMVGFAPILNDDGEITGAMGVFTDITERKRAEEQLVHDAFHDALTGLANRALFMDHLRNTIQRRRSRNSNQYAVLFLDFDRFKVINDSLGHAEGDEILRQIARRLEGAIRTGDLTARLGGDEFVILLNELADAGEALIVAERIIKRLEAPFILRGNEFFMTASIGIALSTAGHQCAEDMVRDADIAMYHAKSNGKAQYQIFDRTMHEKATRQLSIETEMRRALENKDFELHYQPIINLQTGKLKGLESLVRWRHPEHGLIAPMEFIPAAEENGLIFPLGAWILEESCRQMNEWQMKNPTFSHLTISVNLSAKQFSQPGLDELIITTLEKTGLNPNCLRLEITESQLMENRKTAVKTMDRLHDIGVRWSLDDFGTGYSSLGYLTRLPVHLLKIDRSFIGQMTQSKEKYEIVNTIIKLAKNLKMLVVAEGIEDREQFEILRELDCEFGQGYLFSKALDPENLEKFLAEFQVFAGGNVIRKKTRLKKTNSNNKINILQPESFVSEAFDRV